MTIFVTWQLIVTLDSIRNSCDVCNPSHQILAKSAPPKARNRDKVEFATKVRKSNINCCLTMNIKKAFNTSLFSLKL